MARFFLFMVLILLIRASYQLVVVCIPENPFFTQNEEVLAMLVPYSTEVLFNVMNLYAYTSFIYQGGRLLLQLSDPRLAGQRRLKSADSKQQRFDR
jgi:hypothetical protein